MTTVLNRFMTSRNLTLRAMRASVITVLGFGAAQVIRLASNLILTRLLFPEAFGMMALVSVFLVGLAMFSDVGTGAAIMQSKRGDDPAFLDTAWTIQIIRGLTLGVSAMLLAWPIAQFYGEPDLIWYLPASALTLVIAGFNPTRLQTAHRHLVAGRVNLIEIASQVVGIIVAIGLAVTFQSVWALVISGIAAALAQLVFLNMFLPGHRDSLRWDPSSAHELIHFGKWIFVATLCGFATMQADKVIIGKYLTLGEFGLYNIGYFLAAFPMILGYSVIGRVLIPIYRESPPLASAANRLRLRRMRFVLTGSITLMLAVLAFGGVWLVGILYDDRYQAAAGVVVLIAATQMPALLILTCDQSALAAGDSRRFFVLTFARAVFVVTFTLIGLQFAGLPGALIGEALASLAAYPVLVWLVRPHGAWDPLHDALFMAIGVVMGAAALWVNADALGAL